MASEDKKANEQDVAKAREFILAHSKMNARGDSRTMAQTGYLTFMADERMLPNETVRALAAAERDLISAATSIACDDLTILIAKAKEAGEDPADCEADVRISRPTGPVAVAVKAETTSQRPVRPGEEVGEHGPEKITKYGTVSVKIRAKTMIDPHAATKCSTIIGALMTAA